MKVTKDRTGLVTYRYAAGGCMPFELHLLCEVGAPYQAAARRSIAAKKWRVETRELSARPWVADFVIFAGRIA